jgi:hypothetical protein
MSLRGSGLLVLVAVGMAACDSASDTASLPPQQWGNVGIAVEIRPVPPRVGMNEFLVIGTESGGKPAWNMVVMLRTDADEGWRQAIQDGESGVYRKALPLGPGQQALHVKLRRGGEETELEIPIAVQ